MTSYPCREQSFAAAALLLALSLSAGAAPADRGIAIDAAPRTKTIDSAVLLVEFYSQLLQTQNMSLFNEQVRGWYTEAGLRSLLSDHSPQARRAAVLGLKSLGTMASNGELGRAFSDPDPTVRRLASQVCWSVWLRGGTQEQNARLSGILSGSHRVNPSDTLRELDSLIADAPSFAEAFNQRAIVHFQLGNLDQAIQDCEMVLRLNPFHYGACEGMGRCYRELDQADKAIKAYEEAQRLLPDSPHLDQVLEELRRRSANAH